MTTVTKDLYRNEYSGQFAAVFDSLVGWDSRANAELSFLTKVLRANGARRVLDAACGTGFHLILLSGEGLDLSGSDGSAEMVAKARVNLATRSLEIPLTVADWRELPARLVPGFDAILCLGDSFPHLLSTAAQLEVLQGFFELLNAGGILVVDHRNYDRVLEEQCHVETGRDYCCCGDSSSRSLEVGPDGLVTSTYRLADESIFSFKTYPVRRADLTHLLQTVGFESIDVHPIFRDNTGDPEPDFLIQVAEKAR
jgi:glycine/sarcosine N-methyltransferase